VLLVLVLVTAALSPHGASAEAGSRDPGPARVCPAPEPGRFSCLALVRTRPAGKGRAVRAAADDTPIGYGPADLQNAYQLPSATAGTGRTVAVVDAYDNPDAADDLSAYRAQYGLPPCTESTGCFTKVDRRGGDDLPVSDDEWAMEIALDLDMVPAGCPNCRILLVEADSNTVEDLGAAVNTAVARGAGYVSNSYGGDEDSGELAYDTAYFDHPGVVVTAAAGDGDYGTEYPAASPRLPRPGSLPASYPYAHPGALNDVTSGENGFCDTETESGYFCTAGEGYDGPTGLGSPAGVSAFSGAAGGDGATVTVTAPADQHTNRHPPTPPATPCRSAYWTRPGPSWPPWPPTPTATRPRTTSATASTCPHTPEGR